MSSWRQTGGSGGNQGGGKPGSSWRQSTAAPSGQSLSVPPGTRRKTKILATIFGSGISLGLFIWCLTLIGGCDRAHLYVTFSSDRYNDVAIAPNDFAKRDGEALLGLTNLQSNFSTQPAPPNNDFKSQYQIEHYGRAKCLIHYFCLHGRADSNGPLLYLPEVEPDRLDIDAGKAGLWRLDDMWNALKKLPQLKKLVILDVTRVSSNERLGYFENGFLEQLEEQVKDIPNLFVLTSNSRDETNWTSREFGPEGQGGSVFGHFVWRGLQGDADLAPKNGRITVGELHDYVLVQVNRWVKVNRDLGGQHPMLLGTRKKLGDDDTFTIASVSSGWGQRAAKSKAAEASAPAGEASQVVSDATVLEALKNAWSKRAELQANPQQAPYRFDPMRWRVITQQLKEAEQLLRNGDRSQSLILAEQSLSDLDQLKSNATLSALIQKTRSEADTFVERTLARRWLPAPKDAPVMADAQLVAVDQVVRKLLTDNPPPVSEELPLRVLQLHEQLANGWQSSNRVGHPTLGSLTLVDADLKAGDVARRASFDAMYLGDAPRANTQLDEAKRRYERAVEVSDAWHSALSTMNRASAQLPEMAQWAAFRKPQTKTGRDVRGQLIRKFVDAIKGDLDFDRAGIGANVIESRPVDEEFDLLQIDLMELFTQSFNLQSRLFLVVKKGELDVENARKLRDQASALADKLNAFHNKFNDTCAKLDKASSQPQASTWQELNDALRATEILPTTRLDLLKRELESASTLFKRSTEEKSAGQDREESKTFDANRSQWESLWSIQSLSLGLNSASTLKELRDRWVDAWPTIDRRDPERLRELGGKIAKAWRDRKEQVATANTDKSSNEPVDVKFVNDQAARSLHFSDAIKIVKQGKNPTAALYEHLLVGQLLHDAERHHLDYWANWHSQAVSQTLQAAARSDLAAYQNQISHLRQRDNDVEQAKLKARVDPVEFRSSQRKTAVVPLTGQSALPPGELTLTVTIPDPPEPKRSTPIISSEKPRYGVKTGIKENDAPLDVLLIRADDFDADKCSGLLKGFVKTYFRGHEEESAFGSFPVDPCIPQGTHYDFLPLAATENTSSIKVIGYDERPVIFILDCSGSMREQLRGGGSARFTAARNVLLEINRQFSLANSANPNKPPRRASYWAFGHVKLDERSFPPRRLETWVKAAGTPPAFEIVDEGLLQRLNGILPRTEQLDPQANTMLLSSIETVYDELQKTDGGAIIVAITDGADSLLNPDPALPANVRNQLIAEARVLIARIGDHRQRLRAKRRSVELHVVGFDVTKDDRTSLENLVDPLRGGVEGEFHDAPNADQLATKLRDASAPREFAVVPLNVTNADSPQSNLNQAIRGLKPGRYQVQFPDVTPIEVNLRGGEKLDFELLNNSLQQLIPTVLQPDVETTDDRRFAVKEFRIDSTKKEAQFILCLLPGADRTVTTTRPNEVVFDIRPLEDKAFKARNITLKPAVGEAVPAWSVKVSNWPGYSAAVIDAYWRYESLAGQVYSPADRFQAAPLSDVDGSDRKFVLTRFDLNRENKSVSFQWKIDPKPITPIRPEDFLMLLGTRVDLRPRAEAISRDLIGVQREIIETEGLVRMTYQLRQAPEGDVTLEIVPWKKWRDSGVRLKQPLTIRPQN